MKRKAIARDELHALLQATFAKRAAGACGRCQLPRPTLFTAAREGPNWRLPELAECTSLCHTVVDEVVREVGARYDLVR